MKSTTCLVVGSCLILQALPHQYAKGTARELSRDTDDRLFSSALSPQTRDILGLLPHANAGMADLEFFIHHHTRESVPFSVRHHSLAISKAIIEAAGRYDMDPLFLMALIQTESRFNPSALGSHGEIGLMQIKPSTALWLLEGGAQELLAKLALNREPTYEDLQAALKKPAINIAFGTAYLSQLRGTFKGRAHLYLTAYNMGAPNLKSKLRSGEHPSNYSNRILSNYRSLSKDLQFEFVAARHTVLSRHDLPILPYGLKGSRQIASLSDDSTWRGARAHVQ